MTRLRVMWLLLLDLDGTMWDHPDVSALTPPSRRVGRGVIAEQQVAGALVDWVLGVTGLGYGSLEEAAASPGLRGPPRDPLALSGEVPGRRPPHPGG